MTKNDNPWLTVFPRMPGLYLMRCGENDHEAEEITVRWCPGPDSVYLCAICPDLGPVYVLTYHEGLTGCEWQYVGPNRDH